MYIMCNSIASGQDQCYSHADWVTAAFFWTHKRAANSLISEIAGGIILNLQDVYDKAPS